MECTPSATALLFEHVWLVRARVQATVAREKALTTNSSVHKKEKLATSSPEATPLTTTICDSTAPGKDDVHAMRTKRRSGSNAADLQWVVLQNNGVCVSARKGE